MKTQTFSEVTDLVRDILAYTKENTPELIQQPEPPVENPEGQNEEKTQEGPSGHDDYDKETTNEEQTSETKTKSTETEGEGEEKQEGDGDGEAQKTAKDSKESSEDKKGDSKEEKSK